MSRYFYLHFIECNRIRQDGEFSEFEEHRMRLFVACIPQDAWFRDISRNRLNPLIDKIWATLAVLADHYDPEKMATLYEGTWALRRFFSDATLLNDYIDHFDVISSLIVPITRYVHDVLLSAVILTLYCPSSLILAQTTPVWQQLYSAVNIIEAAQRLIAGSSDTESACTTVRAGMDTIPTFIQALSYCHAKLGLGNDHRLVEALESLYLTIHDFLCVVATPFTGVSMLPNSHVLSVL
jgi:hypothetical protein